MNDCAGINTLRWHVIATMKDGARLIGDLDDTQFVTDFPSLKMASIGEHYRHHLEHVDLFLRGAQAGLIDYDNRRRDASIATSVELAVKETHRLIDELEAMPSSLSETALRVMQSSHIDGQRPLVMSNLARELLFLNSHAVHHYAIISIALRLCGQNCDPTLGVMPSTLHHRDQHDRKTRDSPPRLAMKG